MFQPEQLLNSLHNANVAFVVIGGIAAVAQGSSYVTSDLDICYRRDAENFQRLCTALKPLNPSLRGAPPGLPFKFDPASLKAGLNFTLSTSAGDIDLLGEVCGLGLYEDVVGHSEERDLMGNRFSILTLEGLILAKTAAGRTKDLLHLSELKALQALKAL
jgi:predicted nucleotidyltransferase